MIAMLRDDAVDQGDRIVAAMNAPVSAADEAYTERNRVVALLACLYPSGITKTAIEGWDPCWHNCVYIDTPRGQMSWHYHDRDAWLFEDLPSYDKPWDGHSTKTKYRRLAALTGELDADRKAKTALQQIRDEAERVSGALAKEPC